MKQNRFSLTSAILSSLAALLVLTWLLLSFISFTTAENDLLAQKNEEGRLLLASIIHVFPEQIESVAHDSRVSHLIALLAREPSFAGLVIVDAKGTPLVSVGDATGTDAKILHVINSRKEDHAFSVDGTTLHRYAPVLAKAGIAGAARLSLDLGSERARLKKSRHLFLAYFLLDFLLLLGLGYFLLNRLVVAPFRNLLHATERVTAGDYLSLVHVPGCREIAEMAEAFNLMVLALQAKRHELDEHVQSLERTNRELQEAREESLRSEKMASVGLLAAGMAHEVGTPLSAIIGFAGMMRDDLTDDPEKADSLRRIENAAYRIDRIVRSLLDYARPSQSERLPTNPADMVHEVLDLLNAQGALKNVSVTFQREENLPAVIVDRHELQQVLINLLLNARDAMQEEGSVTIRVSSAEEQKLTLRQRNAASLSIMGRRRDDFNSAFHSPLPAATVMKYWVVISVSDTGSGIPAEHLGKIFDPFFTTKEPGQGTGLGLSLSARIVDSFGGRIIAESSPGTGATFTILLPADEEHTASTEEANG